MLSVMLLLTFLPFLSQNILFLNNSLSDRIIRMVPSAIHNSLKHLKLNINDAYLVRYQSVVIKFF